MGAGASTTVKNNRLEYDQLVGNINQLVVDLSKHYRSEFLDAGFCNRVALIFADQLMQYQSQTINGIAVTLGIESPDHSAKLKICAQIVEHYQRRLNLIQAIQQALSFVSERVYAITTGPICAGSPDTFDPMKCKLEGGIWQAKSVLPDPEVPENQEWYETVSMMHKIVMFSVNRLLGILKLLQDSSSTVDDAVLASKTEEAHEIINQLNPEVAQLYWKTITLKTYTKAEVASMKHDEEVSKQLEAARQAQLRAAHGLPVTGGGSGL